MQREPVSGTGHATDPDSLLHNGVRSIDHHAVGQKTIVVSTSTSLTSVNFSGDRIFNAFHVASTCTLTASLVFFFFLKKKTDSIKSRRRGLCSLPEGEPSSRPRKEHVGHGADTRSRRTCRPLTDVVDRIITLYRLSGPLPCPMGPRLAPSFTSQVSHKGRDLTGY